MWRKRWRIAAVAAPLALVGAMVATAAPAWAGFSTSFGNWAVSGTLTPKKLNEPVTLPKGSTFNGVADITTLSPTELSGTVKGSLYVPPFKATLKLAGLIPSEVGVTFTEAGASEGALSFAPASACAGSPYAGQCATMTVTSKAIVGINVIGLLGIDVPTQCQTAEPVTFDLKTTLTLGELLDVGPRFTGTATIPPITCEGPSGLVLGALVTSLMSGPENAYALYIAPREPAAPTVTTDEATSISQVSARLHGNVDPNGAKPSECKFEYGSSTSYGSSIPCQSPPESVYFPFAGNAQTAQAAGLSEGAAYHDRMVVTNSLGTSYGGDQMFTTLDSSGAPQYGQCVAQKDGNYSDGNCKMVAEKQGQPDHKGKYEWVPGPAATCVAQKKGNYTDSGCTAKSAKAKKGAYEKAPGPGYAAAGGAATLETAGLGHTVMCTASTAAGEVTGTSIGTERITFSGCEMSGKQCTSEGANATVATKTGEIVTNMLDTRLLGPVAGQVWTELVSSEHAPYLAEFSCEGPRLRASGSLSGVQSEDIDSSSVTSTTTFAVEQGEQALYTSLSEDGGNSWVEPDVSNVVTVMTNTAASAIEIRP
jgi:hypothetical protein